MTGASRRIGASIVRELAAEGWDVAIHYHASRTEAERLATEIGATGRRAAALSGDLAAMDEVRALVPACIAALGVPTCLINNASEFQLDTLATMTPESWERHLAVNLRAPVFLAQSFAAHLPAGQSGNIINMIDQRVWRLRPEFYSYTIAKSALWSATRTLAQALAPHIRVNAIGPGPVLQSVHQHPEEFDAECRSTLLQRGADVREIADAVRFILGAPAMTGQMIALDGGQHLT